MRIDKFYRDSFTLTVSNLFTGIIGFVFSILLSRNLGAEGLGLYGLIMPIYNLVLSLAADGLVTALSKISAVYSNKRDSKNLNRTMSTILTVIFLWSFFLAVIIFICAPFISRGIIGDPRSLDAVRIICPAIVFISLSAIMKGYFYGVDKFKTAAFIDIIEKILRVTILLIVVSLLPVRNVKNTVASAYLALTVGELTSFLLLYFFYKRDRAGSSYQLRAAKPINRIQLLFNVFIISVPLCINGFLTSIISTASALILPRRLVFAGFPYETALALMGKFLGMASNIAYLPIIIVSSMTTVLVPDLSLSVSRKDYWSVENRLVKVFKAALLVGTSTLIINLLIPEALGLLFYNRSDLGDMIRFASVSSVISFVSAPTFAMLNGLGKQNIVLRNSLLVSTEGIVLIFVFTGIPSLNIYGYGIMMIITSITALVLNFHEIRKICEIRFPFSDAVSFIIAGITVFILIRYFNTLIPDTLLIIKSVFTAISAFGLVYLFFRPISNAICTINEG